MRIALLGSRGIPDRYGGYETLMEELAARLVERGFEVTVYCRSHSTPAGLVEHRGARLVAPSHAPLEAPRHAGPHPALGLARDPRALRRRAGGQLGQRPLRAAAARRRNAHRPPRRRHREATRQVGSDSAARSTPSRSASPAGCADELITDAEVIRGHYRERYGVDSRMLTYGVVADPPPRARDARPPGPRTARLLSLRQSLRAGEQPASSRRGLPRGGWPMPLVMVGDAPYAGEFISRFTRDRRSADPFPRRDLRRRLPRAPGARLRLHPRHRGRRHPPGAGRGDGLRQLRGGSPTRRRTARWPAIGRDSRRRDPSRNPGRGPRRSARRPGTAHGTWVGRPNGGRGSASTGRRSPTNTARCSATWPSSGLSLQFAFPRGESQTKSPNSP